MPKVSVVIPTYNRCNFLEEALRSVFAQTYQDFEILVVDDASSDKTEKTIYEKFGEYIDLGRIKYLRNKRKMERSYSRNRGIKKATGRYIAFLDDDDVWLPNHLDTLRKFMDKHPNIGLSFSTAIRLYEEVPQRVPEGLKEGFGKIYRDKCIYGRVGVLPCSMVRNDVFTTIGGFQEDLNYGEDTEFFARVAMNYDIGYLENVTCCLIRRGIRDVSERLYYSKLKVLQAIVDDMNRFGYESSDEKISLFYIKLSEYLLRIDLDKAKTYLWKALKKNKGLLSMSLTWKIIARIFAGHNIYNFLKKIYQPK